MIEEKILALGTLDVVLDNVADIAATNPTQFTMLRRCGLGASDASVLLGVNPYEELTNLIKQKASNEITAEELAVKDLENVRRGRDLEPIILNKFVELMHVEELHKPEPMYRIKRAPELTINYDGVVLIGDTLIPVEAKYVSKYAGKYWDETKAVTDLVTFPTPQISAPVGSLSNHITKCAAACGIPVYYYTQVQQQLLGLEAPYGYLVSLWDKGWDTKVFYIPQDTYVQQVLMDKAKLTWATIQNRKNNAGI